MRLMLPALGRSSRDLAVCIGIQSINALPSERLLPYDFPLNRAPMSKFTRRQFLEDSILAAAAVASSALAVPGQAAEQRAVSANEKIGVGVIGCGIRGKQ